MDRNASQLKDDPHHPRMNASVFLFVHVEHPNA